MLARLVQYENAKSATRVTLSWIVTWVSLVQSLNV